MWRRAAARATAPARGTASESRLSPPCAPTPSGICWGPGHCTAKLFEGQTAKPLHDVVVAAPVRVHAAEERVREEGRLWSPHAAAAPFAQNAVLAPQKAVAVFGGDAPAEVCGRGGQTIHGLEHVARLRFALRVRFAALVRKEMVEGACAVARAHVPAPDADLDEDFGQSPELIDAAHTANADQGTWEHGHEGLNHALVRGSQGYPWRIAPKDVAHAFVALRAPLTAHQSGAAKAAKVKEREKMIPMPQKCAGGHDRSTQEHCGRAEALTSFVKDSECEQAKGVFSHSAGTAPSITFFIPGTPLKTNPPQRHARSIQSSIGAAEFRMLGPVATVGGKQPTFRKAWAQRTVRPPRGISAWG